jgi:Raf kinase inhibitor-like YbhB/YbcL family protein
MTIRCPALTGERLIPSKYAFHGVRGGMNLSLPLVWGEPPSGTQSFVLSVIDRHPVANNWVHWYVLDIPPSCISLGEGASGNRSLMPQEAVELRNSYGEAGYGGPKPPRGSGPHEYVITLYALKTPSLKMPARATASQCARAMEDLILASASTSGFFEQ